MLRFLSLLVPLSASAAETVGPAVSTGTYLQAALALSLIVAILFAAAWLARKVSGGKKFGNADLKIVGGVALGPRERIVLLEVGEQWLLVGIVPGQIRTLHRMPKGDASGAVDPSQATGEKPFTQWLQHVVERRTHD